MKRITLGFLASLLLVIGCQKKQASEEEVLIGADPIAEKSQRCASSEVFEEQAAADPTLRVRRQQIEDHTKKVLQNKSAYRLLADGSIEIPVVVHVLYRSSAENVSDAQVQSQIAVLNQDFTQTNADNSKVPAAFSSYNTNAGIRFVLKQTIRKYSSKRSWSTNDDMKLASRGGSDAVDPVNNLNLWVVNKMSSYGQSILGYAQFPGGNRATDGVVIAYHCFGNMGTAAAPYNLGRTATHEVGHWLNLNHIWGDDGSACSGTDNVGDTPNQAGYNVGKPVFPKVDACSPAAPGVMFMNYMDYTDDLSMYMFTHGQRDRMRALFVAGAYRAALGQ